MINDRITKLQCKFEALDAQKTTNQDFEKVNEKVFKKLRKMKVKNENLGNQILTLENYCEKYQPL